MSIPLNGEREAAFNIRQTHRFRLRTLQGTAREHCLLRRVKGDDAKLLPVANKRILHDEVMYREFALELLVSTSVAAAVIASASYVS